MNSSQQTRRPRTFQGLDAEHGPARPLTHADTRWLIEQVVERALQPETKSRPRLRSLQTLSLAALAVVTSAAAATVVHQQLQRNAALSAPAQSAPQRQIMKLAPGRARSVPANEPETVSAPSAEAALTANAPAPIREANPPVSAPSSATLPAQEAKVVDELSAANDLRRQSQWQAAEAAYRGIAARYPRTQEAIVAQLAAAELRLDHLGDAAGALRLYQAVPHGNALGVEALFGISRAYRTLGNPAAESAALRSLLDAYPTSLQADGAQARLQQLSAESTTP